MAQWVVVQGQVKVAKKKQNYPHLQQTPSKPQTENENRFFRLFGWFRGWFG